MTRDEVVAWLAGWLETFEAAGAHPHPGDPALRHGASGGFELTLDTAGGERDADV